MRVDAPSHKADGLYGFSLPALDAKGVYACTYGRDRFAQAVASYLHISNEAARTATVSITLDFMDHLCDYYAAACEWFVDQMYDVTCTITYEENERVHNMERDVHQCAAFMDLLYNRAQREGLIPA